MATDGVEQRRLVTVLESVGLGRARQTGVFLGGFARRSKLELAQIDRSTFNKAPAPHGSVSDGA